MCTDRTAFVRSTTMTLMLMLLMLLLLLMMVMMILALPDSRDKETALFLRHNTLCVSSSRCLFIFVLVGLQLLLCSN